MPISATDVKLLKSERLTDEDDGGGRATGNSVIDNEMNNLFADISRLDRTTGRIALRKVFAGVVTQTNDAYLGAHSIVTEAPKDPRVSVLLFNTGSQTDTRVAARNLVESYMAPSASANFELLGNQLAGQRSIICVQQEEQSVPEVGEVFQLVSETSNQYVRITDVEATIEPFVYVYGYGTNGESWVTFYRRRLSLGLSSPLESEFPGGAITPGGTSATSPTTGNKKARILTTQVADAARYYGIAKVIEPVGQGSLSVRVNDIYSQLVPSTSKENPLTAVLAGFERATVLASGPTRSVSLTVVSTGNGSSRTYLTTGCAPGTLSITVNGGTYKDDQAGNLTYVSGTNWLSTGTIDYGTGEITLTKSGTSWAGTGSASYRPGTRVIGDAITSGIEIKLGNRGYVYTLDLNGAIPRPGTLVISYMTLGKWYDLRDNGRGELVGMGTGTVDFGLGVASMTLQALPDVGSTLIYSYISAADFLVTQHTGTVPSTGIEIVHKLEKTGVKPGSVVLKFTVAGATKTATDNGIGGITGDASGSIDYQNGVIKLILTTTPDTGTGITCDYEEGASLQSLLTNVAQDGSGFATFTIQGAPLKPGSVSLQFAVDRKVGYPASIKHDSFRKSTYTGEVTNMINVQDNGSGGWIGRQGTINYSTGQCWLEVEQDYTYNTYTYRWDGWRDAPAG